MSSSSVLSTVAKEQTKHKDVKVEVKVHQRSGGEHTTVLWLADIDVGRTTLLEADWNRLKKKNPTSRLKRNKVNSTPYGTDMVKSMV